MKPVPISTFDNFIPAVLLLFKNRLATGCDNSGDITKRSEVVFGGLLACAYLRLRRGKICLRNFRQGRCIELALLNHITCFIVIDFLINCDEGCRFVLVGISRIHLAFSPEGVLATPSRNTLSLKQRFVFNKRINFRAVLKRNLVSPHPLASFALRLLSSIRINASSTASAPRSMHSRWNCASSTRLVAGRRERQRRCRLLT